MNTIKDKFKCALSGLKQLIFDKSVRLQLILFILACLLFYFIGISTADWIIILICSALVISCEMINTTIEKIMDFIHPDYHNKVKQIKDMSAGCVLCLCIFSVIIAILILSKYIM